MKKFPMQVIPSDNILIRTPLQSLQNAYDPSPQPSSIYEEGLYLSSPEFWQEYQKKDSLKGKPLGKLDRSFTKYWLRSCTRCTPYATLAGCTLAKVSDDDTRITLQANHLHIRKVRLDMNYMTQIIQAILKIPAIFQQVKFFANNSIYEVATGFRYVEYSIHNNIRHYQLTSIAKASYLQSILALANKGVHARTLRHLLIQEVEVTSEEADDFIMDLWQSQLIVSELEPAVTGPEPLEQLINQISNLQYTETLLTSLIRIQGLIQNPYAGVAYYQLLEEELKNLQIAVEIPKNTLQVDLLLSTLDCRFNKELINSIVCQAKDLMFLSRKIKSADLDNFRTRFYERYENAEVPLSIALDADLGIGYSNVTDDMAGGSALINDLQVGTEPVRRIGSNDYIQQYTLTKYNDYLKHGQSVITITEDELEGFRKDVADCHFSNSMFLFGSLMKKEGNLAPDNYIFDLSDFGGPNAGNLLGRFTADDSKLCAVTRALLKEEEEGDPDAIYAEIAHLPQARIGNVLLRPVLRSYEIPYVGKSAADPDKLIPVEDLMVSVHNQDIILRSKKHNKRVIPRLTTAHNFTQDSLPVYKFLCQLQYQGLAHPNVWDWGLLSEVKLLPRVVYKNLILKKAQWRITEKDIEGLPKDQSGYMAYFRCFREQLKLPERVVYVEHDNELLIDFEQDRGIRLFLHYLSRHKKITLEEFLATPDNCIVRDTAGEGYTNEIIIPLRVKREPVINSIPISIHGVAAVAKTIQRKFGPCSQWLYFKVYCGSKTGDILLKKLLFEFVENGLHDALFEQFFFIRYKDEFPHLRIRFFNSDTDKQIAVQKAFLSAIQPYLDAMLVDKVVIDTYVRELERYGADMIGYSEQLFFADSLAIVRFMNLIEGVEGDKYRMLFALRSIDMLLDDFQLDLAGKRKLSEVLQASFFKEFGADPILQKQLNEKYRERQESIFSHMDSRNDGQNGIEEAVNIFQTRSRMNLPVIASMFSAVNPAQDLIVRLLPDLIHVSMNRLFIAQQRKYELTVYHFLDKYYTSQMAIRKQRSVSVPGQTNG
jgi:class I lanthipeptide synthase